MMASASSMGFHNMRPCKSSGVSDWVQGALGIGDSHCVKRTFNLVRYTCGVPHRPRITPPYYPFVLLQCGRHASPCQQAENVQYCDGMGSRIHKKSHYTMRTNKTMAHSAKLIIHVDCSTPASDPTRSH